MDVPCDVARNMLERVTSKAAEFGARTVRLGTGQRICLVRNYVTTVLPKQEKVKRNGIRRSFYDRISVGSKFYDVSFSDD